MIRSLILSIVGRLISVILGVTLEKTQKWRNVGENKVANRRVEMM